MKKMWRKRKEKKEEKKKTSDNKEKETIAITIPIGDRGLLRELVRRFGWIGVF